MADVPGKQKLGAFFKWIDQGIMDECTGKMEVANLE